MGAHETEEAAAKPKRLAMLGRFIREVWLLGAAERAATAISVEDRESVRAHLSLARAHRKAARSLFRFSDAASCLVVYRSALEAYFAAIDLVGPFGTKRPEVESAVFEMAPSDALLLRGKQKRDLFEKLDRVCTLCERSVEERPLPAIRRARIVRIVLAALLLMGIAVGVVLFLKRPKNVAIGRPISASSSYYGEPSALVNGAIEWGAFGFHTKEDRPGWVLIDLGASTAIQEVRIFNRGDGSLDDAIGTEVDLSDDMVTFQPRGVCKELFTQATPCRLNLGGLRGRYVKVLHPRYLALSEIEVYGAR